MAEHEHTPAHLQAIATACEATGLESHPFVTAWIAGELSRDELRAFAPQFYALVDAWPRIVSSTHSITPDPAVRRQLVRVLQALDAAPPTAADLWLQTCSALGLFSDTVRAAEPSHATEACINDFTYLASHTPTSGVTALIVLARELRMLCRRVRPGLIHAGLETGPGATFFDVVSYTAEIQERTLTSALALEARDEHATAEIADAARTSSIALRGMFDSARTLAFT